MSDIIHNETLFNSFLYYSLTFIPNSLSSRFKPSISVLFSKVGLRIEIETFGFDFFALRLGRHERCGARYCVLIVELHGFHIFGAGIRRIFVTGREHGANLRRDEAPHALPLPGDLSRMRAAGPRSQRWPSIGPWRGGGLFELLTTRRVQKARSGL